MKEVRYLIYTAIIAVTLTVFAAYATERYPVRIVSLGPTITEKLFILGDGDRLIGVTTYCQRPPQARKKEKVGSVTQANVEKILQLSPDLVIATPLTDPRVVTRLRSLGLKTIVFNEPNSFQAMNEQFVSLGKIVGKEEEARQMVKEAERKVGSIRNKSRNTKKPRVFIQVGTKPLFTATKESFINDFIEYAGGVNIAAEAPSGSYSRELVLKQDPEIILITAMGLAAEEEKAAWQKFPSLSAVKTGSIYIVDPYKVCSPTPVTFAETLQNIFELLHPDTHLKGDRR